MKTTDFITEGIAEDADEMHRDHEVQMARADCYNAAKYAIELHKLLHKIAETQGLDGWVSEKITLANDYLRTVHEYLTHEMAQGQQDTVIIPEFSFESANAEFNRLVNEGVAEAEKNPHTSALGKALHRDLSKEKKASPAQVKRNQERWAQRQKAKAEQPPTKGMSNAEKVDKGWRNPNIDEGTEEKDPIWNKGTPMPKDYTCPCGIHVHPSIRNPKAIHDPGCPYAKKQGVAEGLPQTLRKVVPGYAKREIDKKMDAGKFGKTDADKDANFQRYKKIQDKIKEPGVAEGSEFGAYYYEQLAQQTFDINPNLQDENEILNLGYKIAKGELGSRAQGMFRDEDFPSDFVTAYGYLKKQGVAEMRNTGDPMDDMVEDYLDWLESVNMLDKSREEEKASILAGLESGVIHSSEIEYALSGTKWDPLAEVSDETLTSYLTKVDADSQKHEKDPTKRSAEKRNKSVAGFSRAFNKLDARKEKVDEIDPNNYDSDEDYYRDLEAQDQRNGAAKRPYNPDWDADDEEFMQKWYKKHGLAEKETNEAQYDRGDYYNAKLGGEYGKNLTPSEVVGGDDSYRGAHKKSGFSKKLPSDPFGRTTGKIPDSAKPKKELDPFRDVNESASAGGTGAGSIATAIASVSSKPSTGKPKKVGNMISRKKPQIGKGIY